MTVRLATLLAANTFWSWSGVKSSHVVCWEKHSVVHLFKAAATSYFPFFVCLLFFPLFRAGLISVTYLFFQIPTTEKKTKVNLMSYKAEMLFKLKWHHKLSKKNVYTILQIETCQTRTQQPPHYFCSVAFTLQLFPHETTEKEASGNRLNYSFSLSVGITIFVPDCQCISLKRHLFRTKCSSLPRLVKKH